MTFKNDTDRLICEESWAETLELMAEFGLLDIDAQVKQHQIEVLESGLPVGEIQDSLESEPF